MRSSNAAASAALLRCASVAARRRHWRSSWSDAHPECHVGRVLPRLLWSDGKTARVETRIPRNDSRRRVMDPLYKTSSPLHRGMASVHMSMLKYAPLRDSADPFNP